MINCVTAIEDIRKFLSDCGLPTADISLAAPPLFFGVSESGLLVAIVGLQLFGSVGLLRSLAVLPAYRGKKIAMELVAFAEEYALTHNTKELFLLTETAEPFFSKLGYRAASRSEAPDAIRSTSQYSGLCPASSAFLSKRLSRTG